MALTLQSIALDAANDNRNVLDPVANFNLFSGWIDRIHKDCLHSSVYASFNVVFASVTTASGTRVYNFTAASPIRRILGVYDTLRDRIIFPIERATSPINQLNSQEPSPGGASSPQTKFGTNVSSALSFQSSQPEYYKYFFFGGQNEIVIYPTPKQAIALQITCEAQVATLVNPTDTLIIPDDGRDMIVAGVNWLVNMYLKRAEEAQVWLQLYENLKKGQTLV